LSVIAGLQDFRQEGAPADIGVFQLVTGVMVFKHTFAGTTYVCAIRRGERGWVLIDYLPETAANTATVINSAIASGAEEVTLTGDTFTINAAITDNGQDDVTFAGMGKKTILYVANATQINAFEIDARTGWVLKDFQINGNKANNVDGGVRTIQNGVHLANVATNIRISGVTVRNTVRTGIKIGSETTQHTGPQYVLVTDCDILDCGLTGVLLDGDGICGYGAIRCIVSNCTAVGSNLHGIMFVGGEEIVIEGNQAMESVTTDGICLYNCDHVTIQANVCGDNYNYGIVISQAAAAIQNAPSHWVTISGNVVYDTDINDGIYLMGSAANIHEQIVIANNTVKGPANNGIATNYATELVISGNTVETCGNGIFLDHSSWATITGNFVSDTTGYGIGLSNTPNVNITGCTCKLNTLQGINIINASDNFVVSGCLVQGSSENNIHTESNNGTISDCAVLDATKRGIYIKGDQTVVSGCVVLGNGWGDLYTHADANATRFSGNIYGSISDNGTLTIINGLGREAAGGAAPAGAWQIGDIVQDTDNPGNMWIKDYGGNWRALAP